MTEKTLQTLLPSHPTSDGDGVKIRRVGLFDQPAADPFLMLDELVSDDEADYIGGFPPHPHRGMETLTYLIKGALKHRDHLGNKGEIRSGGAQWMSAGKGIIHSEMPELDMGGLHGFQLWINLPASEKMLPPKYRDVPAPQIPILELEQKRGQVAAIAGRWIIDGQGINGPLDDLAAHAGYLDISLNAGASLILPVPEGQRCLVYVFQGQLEQRPLAPAQTLFVFSTDGDSLTLNAQTDSRMLMLTGTPIKEPVVHYGPFVMNTHEEIEQAIRDYQSGSFGK